MEQTKSLTGLLFGCEVSLSEEGKKEDALGGQNLKCFVVRAENYSFPVSPGLMNKVRGPIRICLIRFAQCDQETGAPVRVRPNWLTLS